MQTHKRVKKRIPGLQPGTRFDEKDAPAKHIRDRCDDYTPFNNLNKSPDLTLKEQTALWWLQRDFLLLPVQPDSKRLVAGFGFYQNKISTPAGVHQWFGERSLANLAVCGTQTSFILDFDDADLYQFWAGKFPDAAKTYTELTPRGGRHVFAHAWTAALKGLQLISGVELKHVVVVSPSQIGYARYARGDGELLKLDADIVLEPLRKAPPVETISRSRADIKGTGRLKDIKAAFSCLELLRSAKPDIRIPNSNGVFVSLRCPFHDDKKPSFWIHIKKNLWGCHSCGIRGDVVNLFARLKGITNAEAIQVMGKML